MLLPNILISKFRTTRRRAAGYIEAKRYMIDLTSSLFLGPQLCHDLIVWWSIATDSFSLKHRGDTNADTMLPRQSRQLFCALEFKYTNRFLRADYFLTAHN